jgi:hypothetical protein
MIVFMMHPSTKTTPRWHRLNLEFVWELESTLDDCL